MSYCSELTFLRFCGMTGVYVMSKWSVDIVTRVSKQALTELSTVMM